jgi:hypothetical protein
VALGGAEGEIVVATRGDTPLRRLGASAVNALAGSPGGGFLVAGDATSVRLWPVEAAACRGTPWAPRLPPRPTSSSGTWSSSISNPSPVPAGLYGRPRSGCHAGDRDPVAAARDAAIGTLVSP